MYAYAYDIDKLVYIRLYLCRSLCQFSAVLCVMAKPSVFKRAGRSVYTATVKLWDAKLGEWKWKQVSTHVTDEGEALGIANTLVKASREAKDGHMTRERAEKLIGQVLNLAGVPWTLKAVTLEEYGKAYVNSSATRSKDPLKAKAPIHWKRFSEWAGNMVSWPMENLETEIWQEYYADLLEELSERTANDHLATFRQMYGKAIKEGKVRGNPVAFVDTEHANSVEREIITRSEMVALLRTIRRTLNSEHEKPLRDSWLFLALAGWHFGHRIQDMLSLTSQNLKRLKDIGPVIQFETGKKERKGGEMKGRIITLPIQDYMASILKRVENLRAIIGADNTHGKVSTAFIGWLKQSGVIVESVDRGKRSVSRKSYHSLRHALTTRLASANIERGLAAVVTDHESKQMQRHYTHAEIAAIKEAMKKARRV